MLSPSKMRQSASHDCQGGLSDYAVKVGKSRRTVRELREAAEVCQNLAVNRQVLHNKTQHLCAIHALPEDCWGKAFRDSMTLIHMLVKEALPTFPEWTGTVRAFVLNSFAALSRVFGSGSRCGISSTTVSVA